MHNSPEPDEACPGALPVALPRRQAGNSPQGLAVTLLADYGLRTRPWLPSGAIVALLTEFGVTPASARAAISRLTRRGTFESTRQGRHTSYRLTPSAAAALSVGGAAIAAFPTEVESWDGHWTLIAFSLPQTSDVQRRALRNRLRWLGFALLYDALWVSPLDLPDGAAETLGDISRGAVTVFRARWLEVGGTLRRDPLDAWDQAGISRRYEDFIQEWSPLLPRIRAGDVSGTEALRARTAVMDTYRHFLFLDPRLPLRLMPPDWPRTRARDVFTSIYDGLIHPALHHVARTVARHAEGPPPTIAAHTVADLLAGIVPATPE